MQNLKILLPELIRLSVLRCELSTRKTLYVLPTTGQKCLLAVWKLFTQMLGSLSNWIKSLIIHILVQFLIICQLLGFIFLKIYMKSLLLSKCYILKLMSHHLYLFIIYLVLAKFPFKLLYVSISICSLKCSITSYHYLFIICHLFTKFPFKLLSISKSICSLDCLITFLHSLGDGNEEGWNRMRI